MNSFFDEERVRDGLAKNKKYKEFRKSYQNPINIKDKNTKNFWDYMTTTYKKILLDSPIYNHKIKLVLKNIQSKSGNLLDIGLGVGEIEAKIQSSKLSIHGIDISPVVIKKVKQKLKGDYKIGSIFNIPYPAHSMDIVLALDVLEHLSPNKVFKAYTEIYRVLKIGGDLIISVPINENLEKMFKSGINPNNHLRVYTPDIISTELKISGFKIIKKYYLYAFFQFYSLKTFLVNLFKLTIRKPNLMIIFCQKI